MPNVIKQAPETDADPARLRTVGITGKQRPTRKRQRPAVMPDMLDAMEIRASARRDFTTNDTIRGARAAAALAAQDKGAKRAGGPTHLTAAKPLARRWVAFVPTGRLAALTPAQARSLRRRSTRAELLALAPHERLMIGLQL